MKPSMGKLIQSNRKKDRWWKVKEGRLSRKLRSLKIRKKRLIRRKIRRSRSLNKLKRRNQRAKRGNSKNLSQKKQINQKALLKVKAKTIINHPITKRKRIAQSKVKTSNKMKTTVWCGWSTRTIINNPHKTNDNSWMWFKINQWFNFYNNL